MNEQWIVYRDIAGWPRQQFEQIRAPREGEVIVRDQVFPAGAGYAAMYIRRHRVRLDDAVVNLITYTEAELSAAEVAALAREATRDPGDDDPGLRVAPL